MTACALYSNPFQLSLVCFWDFVRKRAMPDSWIRFRSFQLIALFSSQKWERAGSQVRMIRSQQTSRLTGLEDYQWIMTLISLCFSQKVIAGHFYGSFASFKSLKLQCPFIYFQRMSKRYINENSLYVQKRRNILWMNKWQC